MLQRSSAAVLFVALLLCACDPAAAPPAPAPPASSSPKAPEPTAPAQTTRYADPPLPPAAFADPERRKKLEAAFPEVERFLASEAQRLNLPGLAAGIVIDGELAYH